MMRMLERIERRRRRALADHLGCRAVRIDQPRAIVSFTFDDAPASAFRVGSEIVLSHGARATFFVSLGLLGTDTEIGRIACTSDLERAIAQGHELGCHTYDHLDGW